MLVLNWYEYVIWNLLIWLVGPLNLADYNVGKILFGPLSLAGYNAGEILFGLSSLAGYKAGEMISGLEPSRRNAGDLRKAYD